jgi:hypothetical protein
VGKQRLMAVMAMEAVPGWRPGAKLQVRDKASGRIEQRGLWRAQEERRAQEQPDSVSVDCGKGDLVMAGRETRLFAMR